MKQKKKFIFRAKLWIYPGDAAWHFVYVPKHESAEIQAVPRAVRRGFGAVRVQVTLGSSVWKTSIFPDKKSQAYLLPIKASVRKSEQVYAGDEAKFTLELQ